MSSIPPPPIRDFYDSDGEIKYSNVYEYLNSFFGSKSNTRRLKFKLPSLAIPDIFEQPTQTVSFDENSLDSNIQPFTLYYFFNDEVASSNIYMGDLRENHTLYEITRFSPRGNPIAGSSKPIVIEKLYSVGRFVFIVPLQKSNKIIIFSRQSSMGFLKGEGTYSWKHKFHSSITDCFKLFKGHDVFAPIGRMTDKYYSQYKSLIPPHIKTRTLNYSKIGFQSRT